MADKKSEEDRERQWGVTMKEECDRMIKKKILLGEKRVGGWARKDGGGKGRDCAGSGKGREFAGSGKERRRRWRWRWLMKMKEEGDDAEYVGKIG